MIRAQSLLVALGRLTAPTFAKTWVSTGSPPQALFEARIVSTPLTDWCTARTGTARAPGTPKEVSAGPIPRMSRVLLVLPPT